MTRTNNTRRRATVAALVVTGAIASLATSTGVAVAGSSSFVVDDDGAQCQGASFTSIQAAVDAAPPGTRITVCDGTYVEQVTIPAGKDRVTLESNRRWSAVIVAPAAMAGAKAILHVTGATQVTIRDFTITGPGGGTCDSLLAGVLVDGGGNAAILRNRVIDIRDEPLGTCQSTNAVQIGAAGPGTATVRDNIIERYQKTGVAVTGVGSVALVEKNVLTGVGPAATIAQNGIQISDRAVATVSRNTVSNNLYSPQDLASTGILVRNAARVVLDRNIVQRNDVGVYVLEVAGDVTVRGNRVSFSTWDGIALIDSTGGVVSDNRSSDNGSAGASSGPGIGVYGTTSSVFERNVLERNLGSGLFFDTDTSDNTIGKQVLKNNLPVDCEDFSVGTGTSGTANSWPGRFGTTENVPGLCTSAQPAAEAPSAARMPAIAFAATRPPLPAI